MKSATSVHIQQKKDMCVYIYNRAEDLQQVQQSGQEESDDQVFLHCVTFVEVCQASGVKNRQEMVAKIPECNVLEG